MSESTQIEFSRLVKSQYERYKDTLNLSEPRFEYEGFITRALMDGANGYVKMRCGPAEYHAEVFVHSADEQKCWKLADLISVKGVRDWLMQNRASVSGKARLEAEVETAFRLLAEGLNGVPEFDWLHKAS